MSLYAQNGEKVQCLRGHRKRIIGMCKSDDGILYTASADGTVREWDMDVRHLKVMVLTCWQSGECFHSYSCREQIFSVALYKNMLCCSMHQEVYCWDVENHENILPFVGISTFTVCEDKMIGWNRSTKSFEFWDINVSLLEIDSQ